MKKTIISSIGISFALLLAAACTQEDLYSSEDTTPTVGINDKYLTFDGKTEKAKILIESNIWWKAHIEYGDTDENWLDISPADGFGNIEINVTTDRNYDLTRPKTAKLIIESDDEYGTFYKEYLVTQNPSDPYIEIEGIEDNLLRTSVTRNETALTLYTNTTWAAESADKDWCTVESDVYATGQQTIRLVCQFNSWQQERSTAVTFRSKTYPDVQYILNVVQSGTFDPPTLVLEKDNAGRINLSWNEIMGAVKFTVILMNGDATIAEIDNGTSTACDLSSAPVFATPEYVGMFEAYVHAESEDPDIYSDSNREQANSHFASGTGTAADPFVIDADCYLRNIALANNVAGNCHYRLDYSPPPGNDFEPICSPDAPFKGIFDGNGHVISGWEIEPVATDRNYFGLFGGIAEGGTVSNLGFSDCSIFITNSGGSVNDENNGFAWVAAVNNGTISNIGIENCTIGCQTGTSPLCVGGITGSNNGTVSGCTVSGAISAATDRNKNDTFECGGIAGYNNESGIIENCTSSSTITAMDHVGGIVGMNGGTVRSSVNTGNITANYYFGGVVGHTTSSSATCLIEDCANTGTLTMSEPSGQGRGAAYLGGIISRIYSPNTTVIRCYNTGNIVVGTTVSSSSMRIGGIVGQTNKAGQLIDCYNTGNATISGKADYGGIVGIMGDYAAVIQNCHSVGNVTVDGGSGNIYLAFGNASDSAIISGCYALDTGTGVGFAGGNISSITQSGLLSAPQMADQASFAGWDFSSVWEITNGEYPTLRK